MKPKGLSLATAVVAVLAILVLGCGRKKQRATREDGGGDRDAMTAPGGILDPVAVAASFDTRCVAGELEACRSLAIMYTEGAGVPADPRRATALFGQACNGGNLAACNQLALALSEGLGVAQDPAHAVEVYQRTCDAGYQLACRNLGLMLRDGRGVTADAVRARVLLDRACTGGAPFACTNAGDLDASLASQTRERPAADALYKQMVAHYKRGCDEGDPTSCRQMGVAYLEGRGLPNSTAAAAVWLDRGCRADDPVACRVLGAMRVRGIGVERDLELGRGLLTRACARRDEEACTHVSSLPAATSTGTDAATPGATGSNRVRPSDAHPARE